MARNNVRAVSHRPWLWSFSRLGAVFLLLIYLKLTRFNLEGSKPSTGQGRRLGRTLLQSPTLDLPPNPAKSPLDRANNPLQDFRYEDTPSNRSTIREDAEIDAPCSGVWTHDGYPDMCSFVKAHPSCQSGTFVEYLHLHFCYFKHAQLLSYGVLALWLVILFYTLGNTAADYFCPSLQHLADLLHLPPTVAGVTLLPLGNGAPDVFASIAAFVGAGQGQVGLNSVIGAGSFVTSVVVGVVSIVAVSSSEVQLQPSVFFRDVGFYLTAVVALTGILFYGHVSFLGAAAFFSIYILYGIHVAGSAWLFKPGAIRKWTRLRPVASEASEHAGLDWDEDEDRLIGGPDYQALDSGDSENDVGDSHELNFEFNAAGAALPQWMWTSHVAIYGLHAEVPGGRVARPLWGWDEEEEWPRFFSLRGVRTYLLEGPLLLPRRVTIPFIEPDGWSKSTAVASVVGAPFLLTLVFVGGGSWLTWAVAGGIGLVLGGLAMATTSAEHPPQTRWAATLWCSGGFVMSVAWFYLVANELVAVLIALGVIAGVDPALLGLTVLAWGNSIGDLVANSTIAAQGGAQMAVAGCYAGPTFNMLVGTGMSLVLASWQIRPEPFEIPKDVSIFVTLGFLALGLLFALVYVPFREFRLTRTLGVVLISLYSTFMLVRIAMLSGVF